MIAMVGGVFGLLAELLRRDSNRGSRDVKAHDAMAVELRGLARAVKVTQRDVGGMRADLRQASARLDRVDSRLDRVDTRLDDHLNR